MKTDENWGCPMTKETSISSLTKLADHPVPWFGTSEFSFMRHEISSGLRRMSWHTWRKVLCKLGEKHAYYAHMEISINGGTPKLDCLRENITKTDDLGGTPHFRKPPYICSFRCVVFFPTVLHRCQNYSSWWFQPP